MSKELHRACSEGELKEAEEAVAAGADVNWPGSDGWTPLHMVGVHKSGNSEKLAALLLKNRADPDRKDGRGRTPLFFAGLEGLTDTVKDMLAVAKDLHATGPGGMGTLGNAARAGHHSVVKLLMDARADPSMSAKMVTNEADHEMRRLYGIVSEPAQATSTYGYKASTAGSATAGVKAPTEL